MSAPPLLLHIYSTFAIGGPQVRFAAIANHHGRRWRHAIIAMDGDLACRERLSPGLDLQFPTVGVRKGDLLGNVRRFRALLRELRPAALVTSNWGTIEWAISNTIPLVRHLHIEDGFGPEERERQIPRRVWMRRLFLHRATIALPSRTLWEIATKTWRLNAIRLRYVPNGINLDRFQPSDRVNAPPVIGTVAALRPEKNLRRLIRAFALVRARHQCTLVIAGHGPERQGLEQLANELGIGSMITFTGHVADPRPLYAGFDIFAMSSDTEQMPLSLLEAMAAGLPVAATNAGDVRFMLAPPNRDFVTPAEDAALAGALDRLILGPDLRQALGAANRAKAELQFGETAMLDAWGRLFDGTFPPNSPREI